MHLIHPNEIGSKVTTLIGEAAKFFYAVTPFVQVHDWKKLHVNLKIAFEKGVDLRFFIRELKDRRDRYFLESHGVKIYYIKDLHTKLYFNEEQMLFTSMNLYEHSDLNAVELGILYDDQPSYDKLFSYFSKYINPKIRDYYTPDKPADDHLHMLFLEIKERFDKCKFTPTDNYIFSRNLVDGFHTFIEPGSISFKYPKKYPEQEIIDKLTLRFDKFDNVQYQSPTPNYSYPIWKIILPDKEIKNYYLAIEQLQYNLN